MARSCLLIFISVLLISCNKEDDGPVQILNLSYTFDSNKEGWIGGFSDYPAGEEELFELIFEHSNLPFPLSENQGALKFSGKNRSDDLFMFLKKEISNLNPSTEYSLIFNVEFASNVPNDRPGIGGSPGESVFIKAGATAIEPETFIDTDGRFRMNIDKEDQAAEGEDMIILGNFSNGTDEDIYTLKTISNHLPFKFKTNEQGSFWLIVGTDSGFEGVTTIYYNKIQVEISYLK